MKKLMLFTGVAGVMLGISGMSYSVMAEGDPEHRRHGKGAKMFKKMDTDGDGAVSRAEADAFHDKRFSRMDANGDGKVTKEEARQMREKHRERKEKKQGDAW